MSNKSLERSGRLFLFSLALLPIINLRRAGLDSAFFRLSIFIMNVAIADLLLGAESI